MAADDLTLELCQELIMRLSIVESLIKELNGERTHREYFKKSLNILRSRDYNGFKKIPGDIKGNTHWIFDNNLYDDDIVREIESALSIADKLLARAA